MDEQNPAGPKKTETLQIRIAHETKEAFLDACRRKGESASDVLRRSILDYLAFQKRPSPQHKGLLAMIPVTTRKMRYLLAGAAATIGLGLFAALPSAADPNLRTAFQRLDADHDGKLTLGEFKTMPFPNSVLARDARVNGVKGLPSDLMLIEPGTRQDSVQPRSPGQSIDTPETVNDFRRFDADGDKAVSYDEFEASLESMLRPAFEVRDANHDGKLSAEELNMPLSITANLVTSSRHAPGPLYSSDPAKTFDVLDRNKDGVITFEEYLPPA